MKDHGNQQDHLLSFAELMEIKNNARIKQVRAIYDADRLMLALAADRLKAALRGSSAAIARPRRFSSI